MQSFTQEVTARIEHSTGLASAARAEDDDYAAGVYEGELSELYRLADDHGLNVPRG